MKQKILLIEIIILITVLSLSAVSAATISDSDLSNSTNTSIIKSDTIITKNTDIVSNSNNNNIKAKTTIIKKYSSQNAAGKTKPKSLSHSSILSGASFVSTYYKKNGKLPNYITINKYKFSMPEVLYLFAVAIKNTYENNKASITVNHDIKNPKEASGANIIKKYFTKADYYYTAKRVSSYMTKYNEAPNFVNTKIGKMQYQTLIYSYAQILNYYKIYKKLPAKQLVNVETTADLNKNLPKYTRTNDSNQTPTSTPVVIENSNQTPTSTPANVLILSSINCYIKNRFFLKTMLFIGALVVIVQLF